MSQAQEYQNYLGYVDPGFLRVIRKFSQARKQEVYAALRVQAGSRVLDVGCGPGTDTIPLAQLVGPTGYVVGLDQDEVMLAEADKQATAAGVSGWVEHKAGDAAALPIEASQFDACHSERLFMHLLNPEQVFAELVRVTKAGGWIAVIDWDAATLSIATPEIETERRLTRFWGKLLHNGYAGRQLLRLFKQYHLADVTVDVQAVRFPSLILLRYFIHMDTIENAALQAGVVTPDELYRFHASLEQAVAAEAFYCTANQVTVVGRKPGYEGSQPDI